MMPRTETEIVDRLAAAMNAHDLPAFLECIHEDYREALTKPKRGLGRKDKVQANWAQMFLRLPDFRAQVLRTTTRGDEVWTEWRWSGTEDGKPVDVRGITIFDTKDGKITEGRLYIAALGAK